MARSTVEYQQLQAAREQINNLIQVNQELRKEQEQNIERVELLERRISQFDILTVLSQSGLLKRIQISSQQIEKLVTTLVELQISLLLEERN